MAPIRPLTPEQQRIYLAAVQALVAGAMCGENFHYWEALEANPRPFVSMLRANMTRNRGGIVNAYNALREHCRAWAIETVNRGIAGATDEQLTDFLRAEVYRARGDEG